MLQDERLAARAGQVLALVVLLVVLVTGLVAGVGEAGVDGVVQVQPLAVPGRDDGVRGDAGVVAVRDGPVRVRELSEDVEHLDEITRARSTNASDPYVVANYPCGRVEIAQFAVPARARRDSVGRVPGAARRAHADRCGWYRSVHRPGGDRPRPAARRGPLLGLAPGRRLHARGAGQRGVRQHIRRWRAVAARPGAALGQALPGVLAAAAADRGHGRDQGNLR